MSISEFVFLIASLATIGGAIAVTVQYLRGPRKDWRVIAAVSLGLIFVLVCGLLVSQSTTIAVNGNTTIFGGTSPTSTSTFIPSTPTQTASPTDTPTPLPTATPLPKPGTILYRADWSKGADGWGLSSDWKVLNGELLSDGSGGDDGPTAIPPYTPGLADYAVQATVKVDRDPTNGGGLDYSADITLWARSVNGSGYLFDVSNGNGFSTFITATNQSSIASRSLGAFVGKTYTYRFEVKGNQLSAYVNGGLFLQGSDNTYLTPGTVGLAVRGFQVEVTSFEVIAV